MTDPAPEVGAVVLNWNGAADTEACVRKLLATKQAQHVVVVDNHSDQTDYEALTASLSGLCEMFRLPLQTLRHGEPPVAAQHESSVILTRTRANLGYARGNNVGIAVLATLNPDYILIINNDCTLEADCVERMTAALDRAKDAALAGPRILDDPGGAESQWPVKRRLTSQSILISLTGVRRLLKSRRIYLQQFETGEETCVVYAIPGSCMLFRFGDLIEMGGFDENTFLYWEEFIIAERLQKLERTTLYVPSAVSHHKLGASTSKLGPRKFVEFARSQEYFFRAYLSVPTPALVAIRSLRIGSYVVRAVRNGEYRRNLANLRVLLRGR